MAPVILEMRKRAGFDVVICATGQHRQMLDQVMGLFGLTPDFDLDLMRPEQSLNALTGRIFSQIDACIESIRPDIVLTHGDTTTAMAASVACFHRQAPVGHVEAGLRTYDLGRPFPEEMNRRVIDAIASYHFAPTEGAKGNLIDERVDPARIFVTGNTIVDALSAIRAQIESAPRLRLELSNKYRAFSNARIRVLVTGHRRESFGDGFENICNAIKEISAAPGVEILYPVHLNPNVQAPVARILSNIANVALIPPIDYLDFVYLLTRADVIVTDSGGVQEEAVSLGKSVLVMRDVTERPEGIAAGLASLVGTDPQRILAGFASAVQRMSAAADGDQTTLSTYGDGEAARRIVDVLDPAESPQSAIEELRCAS